MGNLYRDCKSREERRYKDTQDREMRDGMGGGGFYLAYDYTNILLPSILHPCKSSLRGRGFSLILQRSVENRLKITNHDEGQIKCEYCDREEQRSEHEYNGIHATVRNVRANGHK